MTEYYSLFSEYLNFLSIIWGGIKVAFLSFFIALIILVIFRKIVLVRRRYNALKYLARSYYILVPIICLCFGFMYGALTSSRDQIIEKLPIYQASIQSFVDENFEVDIEIQTYTNKNLDKTIDDTVTEVQQVVLTQLKLSPENQSNTKQFVLTVLESPVGMSFLKSKLKDKVASVSGLDKEVVHEVFEIELSKIFTGETIIKILAFYIKQVFSRFITPIIIIWVLLLLMPLIEIIFAYRYNRKYQISYGDTENSAIK